MSTETGPISRRGIFRTVARAAGGLLLPSRCLACGSGRVEEFFRGGVCAACWSSLPALSGTRCEICDEPLPLAGSARCGRCILSHPEFRTLRGAAPYRSAARQILLAFKFRGADYLGRSLAQVMTSRLSLAEAVDEVTSVPATARARRRGDHAADLLGKAVAKRLDLPFAATRLTKVRETQRQSALPAERRPSNVHGAFRTAGQPRRRILLVDDVATSGATARECARTLRNAGAETVDVWCFARASRDDLRDPEI